MTLAWRIALPTSVAALGSAGTLYLLGADAAYFLEPREAWNLGEASEGRIEQAGSNRYVRIRGVADLPGSLRVGRREGDLRVARLSASGLLVQVPASGSPGSLPAGEAGLQASGLFDGRGRLWRVEDLGGFHRPILRHFEARAPVTHVIAAGEEPAAAWPSFAGALAAGLLGALALVLAARAIVRRRTREVSDGDPPL